MSMHAEFYQSIDENNYTQLELNILMLWKKGHSIKKISQILKLSPSTILFYLKNIELKARLRSEKGNA